MTEPATYGLTTGAVARRLGVSPTTLRSWDRRYGMGPAAREGGRHRRWAPEDVAMLEAMCRLTASGAPPAEAARIARAARTGAEDPGAVLGAVPGTAPGTRARSTEPEPYPDRPAGPLRDRPEEPGPARQPGSGNGLPLGDVRRECRGLARAAVRLDGPALDALLRDAVADHGLVTAWEEVMAPTLHAVGRKWESSGDRYVEVEHLLSWHVSTALRQVSPAGHGSLAPVPPVLLACVPGEQHTLPLEALAAGLSERGLPTRMFGAAVPAEALDAAVRRMGPAAVVLWSQARSTANHALARHVAGSSFGVKGARTRPLMLLAGPGWAGRGPGPGMLRPGGLREALDALSHHAGTRVAAPPV
ncbi:MerR family transcriptional regulator [Streptomyces sp. WAC08241]|uniref:MerR family transcriptional regulator n=1 Tax=Streptomyces sp. WAC08241 TaxID=2487421 RepID=UPI000F787666|nr:MerR family transcriptional regulator [Streptomyces sp. WAC08241]RSS38415.1 MerR family transcriptional regulator [Streptomyces sp. WAC08241]